MQKYKYTATNKEGRKIKGNFVAENETEMKEMLLKAGYYVNSVKQVSNVDIPFLSLSGKVKVGELTQFCNQFSVMISSGISIVEAVDVCINQSFSSLLRRTLIKIKDDLKQGLLLSQAMEKHPRVFPPYFSSMVYIGESSGCLDRVLVSVAEYYELENKTKKKIMGSLAYPIVLVIMVLAVIIVMMVAVIPTFITSFAKMDVTMPPLTLAIFDMSQFFQENWLIIIGFLAAFIIIIWALNYLPAVKHFYHVLAIKLPIFKKINLASFTARFCRSLSILLASGADSLTALEAIEKTIYNTYLKEQFSNVVNDVKMGMSLSAALESEMHLSPILIQMIVVGEKTGELSETLRRTAPYFDRQLEASLNLITTIVQPVTMVILGSIVAVLFLAIYSPILEAIKQIEA